MQRTRTARSARALADQQRRRRRMRFEKPHSLSYQDSTLAKLPSITLVSARRRSTSAGCAVEVDRDQRLVAVARGCPSAARRRPPSCAALISSSVAGFVELARRGRRATRSASARGSPCRRACPSSSGSTSPIALAAPVLVGIIDSAAARARRRSLCGRSRMCWSLVYEWIVVIRPRLMPKRLVQDLGDRREAVRRARRVRDDVVLRRVVRGVVDAVADREVGALRRARR